MRASALGWSLTVFGVCVAAACGSGLTGLDGVTLTVEADTYGVGDTVWTTLANNRSETIAYSFCLAELQRSTPGGWISVDRFPDNGACILTTSTLHSGEASRGMQIMYAFLEPGVYRFAAEVRIDDSPYPVLSNIFALRD